MGYAIVCDSRKDDEMILALVDRAKTRSKWWTSDEPSLAIRYERRSAAEFVASRLRFNGARVVEFGEVAERLSHQAHLGILAECERGWDEHKDLWP